MEPDNNKPGAEKEIEAEGNEAQGATPKTVVEQAVAAPLPAPALVRPTRSGRIFSDREFAQASRRELLKLSPVLLLGAFAIPSLQESLLKKGLGFATGLLRACSGPDILLRLLRMRK